MTSLGIEIDVVGPEDRVTEVAETLGRLGIADGMDSAGRAATGRGTFWTARLGVRPGVNRWIGVVWGRGRARIGGLCGVAAGIVAGIIAGGLVPGIGERWTVRSAGGEVIGFMAGSMAGSISGSMACSIVGIGGLGSTKSSGSIPG